MFRRRIQCGEIFHYFDHLSQHATMIGIRENEKPRFSLLFLVGAFLRKEPTIVMAFRQCFCFRYTLSDRDCSRSSTNFYGVILIHLAWRTEPKRFFLFFPRNIQYWARLKGPIFEFFGLVRHFFRKNSSKGPQFTNTLAL